MNEIDMNAVAQRLAAHLRDWEADPNDNSRVGILQRPDGGRIHLRLNNNGARIEVSGVYPTPISYHGSNPMITISPRRTDEAIARDIEQRFLPEYDRLFAKSWADAENERRRLQEKIETTQHLADLLGVTYRPPTDPADMRELDWSEGDFYARVRTENGRVYMNRVSMSLAEFERMVAAVRTDASAQLMAAAPDMLAALLALREAFIKGELAYIRKRQSNNDPYHLSNTLMCSALDKATGVD